jgi:hypothetical protein
MTWLSSNWVPLNTSLECYCYNILSITLLLQLLKPLESAKKEAQYLFSSHATRTIVNIARGLGAMKVLCLGTPRVHELVHSEMSSEMDSLLLDIDYRFVSWTHRTFLSCSVV